MTAMRFSSLVLAVAACGGGDVAGRGPSASEVTALCERYCAHATMCMTPDATTCPDGCPVQFPKYREDLLVSLIECLEATACELRDSCERVFDDLVWTDTANALVGDCMAAEARCGGDGTAGLNCTDDDIGFFNDAFLERYRACMALPCEEIEQCVIMGGA
jgi:hypothetical protein